MKGLFSTKAADILTRYTYNYISTYMGKPLMIQPEDDEKIESLKEKLHVRTKVEIVRAGLRLLEKEITKSERINRWKKAAVLVLQQSAEINKEFQSHSRLKQP